jgi:hypothetical protein
VSEYNETIEDLFSERQQSLARAVGNVNSSPDDAARAIELGQSTGVDPSVIHGDLEGFEQQHKTRLAAGIVSQNSYIQDYLAAHPLNASLSNDDYANLDKVSESVRGFSPISIAQKAASGFKEGFGSGTLGEWLGPEVDKGEVSRLGYSLWSVLGAPIELGAKLASGAIAGAKAGVEELGIQGGMDPMSAQRLSRETAAMLEFMLLQPGHGAEPHPQVVDAIRAGKSYIESGKEPPVGVHPSFDKIKAEQAELDLKTLDEALKESQTSLTKERSPESFAGFIRQHTTAEIGINAEAVRKLYGDKAPLEDDGVLGWVPGIAEKLESAEATGGDVQVPIADWLAKVDPEIAKELRDDIRVRPGGVTREEAKGLAERAKAAVDEEKLIPDTPTTTIRTAAGLDPILGQERKLALRKVGSAMDRTSGTPMHAFNLMNQEGKTAATLSIAEEAGGKRLYVDDIRGAGGEKSIRAFGPSAMRDVLRQLKAEFPQAEELSGFRVSGARDKAGTWESKGKVTIKLSADLEDEVAKLYSEHGLWEDVGAGMEAKHLPDEELNPKQREILDAVDKEIAKLNLTDVDIEPVEGIRDQKSKVEYSGAHLSYEGFRPTILLALDEGAPGILRHEAIHELKRFLSDKEWFTLNRAAREGKWIDKHEIEDKYGHQGLKMEDKLEEAIAEEFRGWKTAGADATTPLGKAFARIKSLLDAVARVVKQYFGKDLSAEEIFQEIESGKVGGREPKEAEAGAKTHAREPELPQAGTTRMEDRDAFERGMAIGLTQKQYDRYMKLIDKRNAEDVADAEKAAAEDARRRQTKEWKAAQAEIRPQAQAEIESRPAIAADLMLGEGTYLGDKLTERPKLGTEYLSDEQKAALPKEYLAKDGINPDDLAGLFGYTSGDSLIAQLAEVTAQRGQAGMTPRAFADRLSEIETEARLKEKFNDPKDALTEVKDQVASQTQLDLLHEEVLMLGLKNDMEFSIKRGELKAAVIEDVGKQPLSSIDSDKFFADAGRAGRKAEDALLAEKWADAFRAKQQQYIGMLRAKEGLRIEKLKAQFDRAAKRFANREVASVKQEYTNFIQTALIKVGQPVKRSIQDLADNITADGYKSFEDFVTQKEDGLRDLHVPDFLQQDSFRKNLGDLSVEQFEQVNNAIKAMAFNGRNELQIEKAGEKHDLAEVLGQMREKMATLGVRDYPIDRPRKAIEYGKSWWWSGITVESMMNRLDRDNSKGVFNQYIVRPFTEASNYKDRLLRDYQKRIAEVGKIDQIDKLVDNALFIDPITSQPMVMRRRNVLGILQNAGNVSNMKKLAEGYNLEPAQIMDWLGQHTTKEDWDRAQAIGKIFNDLFDQADVMSHQISGVNIQKLPLTPIQTPFGEYPGWYNPIKYDPLRPGESKKLLGRGIEEEGFYRATTPQGYTKGRTGYIAPVELNLDIVPARMKQMIHDIAMRPAVLQLSKVFYDPGFKRDMIKHFGQHQAEEMIPFLRDIANASNFKSLSESMGNQALEFFRQNTIATLIGLNPSTVLKHGPTAAINSLTEVGPVNFAREFASLLKDDGTGKKNWTMAMDKSEELQRRMRNYSELIFGHGSEINIRGAQSKFGSYREFMMSAGAGPVSISDLLSAVPTWLAKYKKGIADKLDEGEAVFEADRAVRRAHGSSVLSNKPAIARTNALGAWFSSLYGFFSHMQQKQYELGWKAKDMLRGEKSGDVDTTRHAPDLIRGFFSYVVAPAVIEELVTPYTNSEKDSWGMKAAKTLAMGVSSSLIGVRDFLRAAINVRDPQAGLAGTTLKAGTDLARDLSHGKQAFTREKAGNIIKHGFAATGVLTGLTNAQEGRALEYLYRYSQGMEHPKGPWDSAVGLRYGKTDKHSRTFDQWLQHAGGK